MNSSDVNRRLKGWAGWFAVAAIAVVLMIFGASRDSGPLTSEERAVALEQQMACPSCDGETVFESGAPAARNIRVELRQLVNDGELSDDQILRHFENSYGEDINLLPKGDGADALVWALPAAAAVAALGGLIVAFRRWQLQSAAPAPTDDERRRVAAALDAERASSAVTAGTPSDDTRVDG